MYPSETGPVDLWPMSDTHWNGIIYNKYIGLKTSDRRSGHKITEVTML